MIVGTNTSEEALTEVKDVSLVADQRREVSIEIHEKHVIDDNVQCNRDVPLVGPRSLRMTDISSANQSARGAHIGGLRTLARAVLRRCMQRQSIIIVCWQAGVA